VLAVAALLPTALANKKDEEAAALLEQAKRLSDIRAEGAPAFRLKMSFKIIEKGGSALEGVYTEVWVSKVRWHRETVVGNFRRTQVALGGKRWQLDSATAVPENIGDVQRLSQVDRFRPEAWKARRVGDREVKGRSIRCLETNADPRGAKSALCFDKSSGVLQVEITPVDVESRIADKACFFADYQKFGDRILARSYECDEDRHPRLNARVIELETEPAPDPALFMPLDGGKESVNCFSMIKAPIPIHTQEPTLLPSILGRNLVVMSLVVGTDGKPHDLRVTSAPNHALDQVALRAAELWTFKPATCEGEPVEAEIVLEIQFRSP